MRTGYLDTDMAVSAAMDEPDSQMSETKLNFISEKQVKQPEGDGPDAAGEGVSVGEMERGSTTNAVKES